MIDSGGLRRLRLAFRVLTATVMFVRVALASSYLHAAALQLVAPVRDHFFPDVLRHPAVMLIAFLCPLISEVTSLTAPSEPNLRRAAAVETVSTGVLLLHQATYFYATWVIVFWAGLLMIWMAWSAARRPDLVSTTGPFLTQVVVAFFFLGGAAGKWTAGYWSGVVFEETFFTHNPNSYLPTLAQFASAPNMHLAAVWFSRGVVVVESLMPLVIFLPARAASVITMVVASGFCVANPDLFEVSLPLTGIALAGWILAAADNNAELSVVTSPTVQV